MSQSEDSTKKPSSVVSPNLSDIERQAEQKKVSALAELVDFLRHNKKWWLAPIVISLLMLAGLVLLSSSAVAPFIYSLF